MLVHWWLIKSAADGESFGIMMGWWWDGEWLGKDGMLHDGLILLHSSLSVVNGAEVWCSECLLTLMNQEWCTSFLSPLGNFHCSNGQNEKNDYSEKVNHLETVDYPASYVRWPEGHHGDPTSHHGEPWPWRRRPATSWRKPKSRRQGQLDESPVAMPHQLWTFGEAWSTHGQIYIT